MNKILIVTGDKKRQVELEKILYEVVQTGVELFFAAEQVGALAIIQREKPQLFLVEAEIGNGARFETHGQTLFLEKRLEAEAIRNWVRAHLVKQASGSTLPM